MSDTKSKVPSMKATKQSKKTWKSWFSCIPTNKASLKDNRSSTPRHAGLERVGMYKCSRCGIYVWPKHPNDCACTSALSHMGIVMAHGACAF
jgi:hypothetical protein